jgi:hypothetical protein
MTNFILVPMPKSDSARGGAVGGYSIDTHRGVRVLPSTKVMRFLERLEIPEGPLAGRPLMRAPFQLAPGWRAQASKACRRAAGDFDAIMLEYHSETNRRTVDALLRDYVLVGGHIRHLHRGKLKFMRKRPIGAAGRSSP